jgi:hypothetical protein
MTLGTGCIVRSTNAPRAADAATPIAAAAAKRTARRGMRRTVAEGTANGRGRSSGASRRAEVMAPSSRSNSTQFGHSRRCTRSAARRISGMGSSSPRESRLRAFWQASETSRRLISLVDVPEPPKVSRNPKIHIFPVPFRACDAPLTPILVRRLSGKVARLSASVRRRA